MVDCRSKSGRDQHNRQWSRRYLLPDTVRTSCFKYEENSKNRGRRKISWKPRCINFNYYLDINNIMASEKEQMGVSNPFLNPLWFWQNYLVNWIEGSTGFYESAIKANEHLFKAVWYLWFRTVGLQQTETEKVE